MHEAAQRSNYSPIRLQAPQGQLNYHIRTDLLPPHLQLRHEVPAPPRGGLQGTAGPQGPSIGALVQL